jgi:hypothetical protein
VLPGSQEMRIIILYVQGHIYRQGDPYNMNKRQFLTN